MKYVGFTLLGILGAFLLYCLVLVVSSLFVDDSKEYDKPSRYFRFLLNSSTFIGLWILRVKISVEGIENVPKDRRFMLVSNHRSNYDPIVTWRVLHDRDMAFITKPDNFKVPFWGKLIRKCAFMGIDRSDAKKSIMTINKAAEKIKNGYVSVGVYPEGTRSLDYKLLPFHTGVFRIAQKADAPIVVMTVSGTELIHRQYIKRRTRVCVKFVELIPTEEVHANSTNALSERVRNDFLNELGQ